MNKNTIRKVIAVFGVLVLLLLVGISVNGVWASLRASAGFDASTISRIYRFGSATSTDKKAASEELIATGNNWPLTNVLNQNRDASRVDFNTATTGTSTLFALPTSSGTTGLGTTTGIRFGPGSLAGGAAGFGGGNTATMTTPFIQVGNTREVGIYWSVFASSTTATLNWEYEFSDNGIDVYKEGDISFQRTSANGTIPIAETAAISENGTSTIHVMNIGSYQLGKYFVLKDISAKYFRINYDLTTASGTVALLVEVFD